MVCLAVSAVVLLQVASAPSPTALAESRAAVRKDPNSAEARNALGTTLGAIGELDGSLRELEIAVRLKPDFAAAHYNLAATRD